MPGPLLAVDAPFVLYRSFFALPDSIHGLDGQPVNALLGSANVLLRIAATNWSTGQLEVFGNADFAGDKGYAAVEASAALPGVFAPVVCGESMYVDGGLIMNTPMKPACFRWI